MSGGIPYGILSLKSAVQFCMNFFSKDSNIFKRVLLDTHSG